MGKSKIKLEDKIENIEWRKSGDTQKRNKEIGGLRILWAKCSSEIKKVNLILDNICQCIFYTHIFQENSERFTTDRASMWKYKLWLFKQHHMFCIKFMELKYNMTLNILYQWLILFYYKTKLVLWRILWNSQIHKIVIWTEGRVISMVRGRERILSTGVGQKWHNIPKGKIIPCDKWGWESLFREIYPILYRGEGQKHLVSPFLSNYYRKASI